MGCKSPSKSTEESQIQVVHIWDKLRTSTGDRRISEEASVVFNLNKFLPSTVVGRLSHNFVRFHKS